MNSEEILAVLQPSAGPSRVDGATYGEIKHSKPEWQLSNFLDQGRVHNVPCPASEFGSASIGHWYESDGPAPRPLRRVYDQHLSTVYAEPIVQRAHRSYYSRRVITSFDAEGSGDTALSYRRTRRELLEPGSLRPDRPEGKKAIPEPYGPPPHAHGVRLPPPAVPSGFFTEPAMPRLLRPTGWTGLRETDREFVFEQGLGRKVRVGLDSYNGYGHAGDKSLVYGPPPRVEDTPGYFKQLKDTPTFIRFCKSLPPVAAVSPLERRTQQMQEQRRRNRANEQSLVASLPLLGEASSGTA